MFLCFSVCFSLRMSRPRPLFQSQSLTTRASIPVCLLLAFFIMLHIRDLVYYVNLDPRLPVNP